MGSLLLIAIVLYLYLGGIYTGWVMHQKHIKERTPPAPNNNATMPYL
jgi:hypothetical protein